MTKKEDHNIPKDYEGTISSSLHTENIAKDIISGDAKDTNSATSHRSSKSSIKIIFILIVAGMLFLSFGWLVVNYSKRLIVSNGVCGDDVVSTYNSASLYQKRDSSEEYTIDEDRLNQLALDIKGRADYQDDPTCQTVLLEVALYNKDYTAAKDAYTSLVELHNKNRYVNSNMNAGSPLYAYESSVQELAPTSQVEANQEPQGGQ